jgi:hypothetical protein
MRKTKWWWRSMEGRHGGYDQTCQTTVWLQAPHAVHMWSATTTWPDSVFCWSGFGALGWWDLGQLGSSSVLPSKSSEFEERGIENRDEQTTPIPDLSGCSRQCCTSTSPVNPSQLVVGWTQRPGWAHKQKEPPKTRATYLLELRCFWCYCRKLRTRNRILKFVANAMMLAIGPSILSLLAFALPRLGLPDREICGDVSGNVVINRVPCDVPDTSRSCTSQVLRGMAGE